MMFPKLFPRTLVAALALAVLIPVGTPAQAQETFTVAKTVVRDRKAVYATVESADTLQARARIGGTIGALEVDEGDAVQAGEQIALIGDEKLALRIEALDAKLSSLRASLEQARTDFQRAEELLASGTIPKSRYDAAQTQLRVAEREFNAMQKERAVIVQQSREGQVMAPGAGRVLRVNVTKGSVIMPGEVIATIASENYILRLNLPERHARFLEAGTPVMIGRRGERIDSNGDLREGTVELVYPEIRNGRLVADVRAPSIGDYFVGERTLVYVPTGERETFVVPEKFIYSRFGLSYVRLNDGTEVVVQAGQPVEGGIEILSGVRDGDVLVTP